MPSKQETKPSRIKANKDRYRTAQAVAWQHLEQLLGKAYKVLDRELNDRQTVILCDRDGAPRLTDNGTPMTTEIGGNWQAAKFVLEKMTQSASGLLTREIQADLSTMEGVMNAAQEVLDSLFRREISVGDAKQVIELLIRYAALRAYDGIAELRALLMDIENKTVSGVARPAGGAVLPGTPKWGRLTPESETSNVKPAE